MIAAVAVGTLIDMLHKGSARYFMQHWEISRLTATRRVGGSETVSLALRTLLKEVAISGEFCNLKRRISHLLMFYGPDLSRHDRRSGFLLPDSGYAGAIGLARAVERRCADGIDRRLLVLLFHPRGRCQGRAFAIQAGARGSVHR